MGPTNEAAFQRLMEFRKIYFDVNAKYSNLIGIPPQPYEPEAKVPTFMGGFGPWYEMVANTKQN